jgi:pyruvate dehydrogenase (quinone)
VDANEPPMPGKIKTNQAVQFAKALLKGEEDRVPIVKGLMKDMLTDLIPTRVRQVL